MQEYLERSGRLFSLAEEHGIPTTPGTPEPLDDSTFLTFKERYHQWAQKRDKALLNYLTSKPATFRVYLPYSPRVFGLASQIVWYFDEILARDPIPHVLNMSDKNIEEEKIRTQELIQNLSYFRTPIEDGYLLFIGSSALDNLAKSNQQLAELLLKDSTILDALKEATYCGYTERPDSQGNLQGVYQLILDSGVRFGFYFKNPKQGHSLAIMVGEILPSIEVTELEKVIKQNPFDQMEDVFTREIERTIVSASQALTIGASILFDRDVDSLILDKAGQLVNPNKQMSTVGLMNLIVPYVKGIPAERLSQLRAKIPTAFKDFRLQLHQLVSEALFQGDVSNEAMKLKVERHLLPLLRQLESEQKAALRKAKITGIGLPLVSTAAILAGSYLAIPPAAVLALGITGIAAAIRSISALESEMVKAEGHPFYFLWRAQHQ